jgi:hypothetical protein
LPIHQNDNNGKSNKEEGNFAMLTLQELLENSSRVGYFCEEDTNIWQIGSTHQAIEDHSGLIRVQVNV